MFRIIGQIGGSIEENKNKNKVLPSYGIYFI